MLKFEKIKYRNKIALERFTELAAPILEEYYKPLMPDICLKKTLRFINEEITAKEIREKRHDYYFICFEGRYIGFIEMKEKEGFLNISKLFLKKEKRNQGFGKKIIKYLKDFSKEQNLAKLRISVPNEKEEAGEIFAKLGFVKVKEVARYVSDDFFLFEHIYLCDID